ncbi:MULTISPECIES: hypothetical protein [unclassified Deinococcus]|uniref:hypothetical protein n=1 Tax=unclassified Deinococcus TaxID=2623546 RepID=UPI001E3F1C4B|nr:hypothetical protein [Deinococcus sp. 6YEL10]MCD0168914.1 hypothetical protein [Deinococcus sp. 23YEL01]
MQKLGLYALTGILGFALIFALLPGADRTAVATGAVLSGVQLTLYPSRDPDAVWQFRAGQVTNDPLLSETRLTDLGQGQRLLRERDASGRLTGRQTLDATLSAPDLTIDGQDNMTTRQARITLVQQCADIDLQGTEQTPVKIEQGSGFSAPVAELDSPLMTGHVEKLRMSFDFNIEDSDNANSTLQYDLDGTERCENGQRVPGA